MHRARWALDEDELATLKSRASYFGLDKTDSFMEYKEKYLKISANNSKINIEIDELTPCLRRVKDNKIVDSYFKDGTPSRSLLKNWEFNWSKEEKKGILQAAFCKRR